MLLEGETPWDLDLAPYYASDLLLYLTSQDTAQIRKYVLSNLLIEDAAQFDEESLAKAIVSRRQIRNRRGMLKGLAMELLAASIIRHLDTPASIVAWATAKNGLPNSAAPGGHPDVIAEYHEWEDAPAFKIIAEVSAMRDMTPDFYKQQLESALRHAQSEVKKSPGSRVYCLLANCGRIAEDAKLHGLYREFLHENGLNADSDIRIVPMYAPDFGVVTGTLALKLTMDELYFDSGVLASAFDTLYQGVLRPSLPDDKDWMIETLLAAIHANLPAGSRDHGGGFDFGR